ncbi:MAG TPA: SRPBCC family protein [Thermoanaerobaculia bacterium]|nr:SRPBCC family protein [Thermoanaerobaculia bacterium]
MPDNDKPNAAEAQELVITRVFDAPRELVFRAWTEPELMKEWWGPRGFTLPHCTIDLQPGGKIHFCMRSAEGFDIWCGGVYHEIVRPERIVSSDYFSNPEGDVVSPAQYGMPDWPEEMMMTVTFTEENGRTTLTVRQTAKTPMPKEGRDGADVGWNEQFDRLSEYLVSDRGITVTRIFDAPRELVFDAFTDPRYVGEWWGPNGFTITTKEMDVRPGGVWDFMMHGPDGRDYHNRIVYVDVERPSRLVYDHETGPLFRATVTFLPAKGSQTAVTVQMVFETTESRDHVVKEYGAIEGLHQTLGRFAEHLSKRGAA